MQLLNQSGNEKEDRPVRANRSQTERFSGGTLPSAPEIVGWLRNRLARELELEPDQIDTQKDFADCGLSSVEAVNLSGDLESFLGCRLPPTLLWDYPTIDSLARYLEGTLPPPTLEPESGERWPENADALLVQLERMSDAEVDTLLDSMLSQEDGRE